MPTILLIGATGLLGREVVKRVGNDTSFHLRSLARRPDALSGAPGEKIGGDVLDPASLERAMQGVDIVINALGTPLILKGPVTLLLSEGTRNILASMQSEGVSRLLCVTGMGAGDSRGHGGWFYDHALLPLLLGRIYVDKNRQEAEVTGSGCDWTLIRPAILTNGPKLGTWREIRSPDWIAQKPMSRISRADVARFIHRELQQKRYSRAIVNLSY